jgi:hypothetical protein
VFLLRKRNLEECKMGIPKRKNDIEVYGNKDYYQGQKVLERRQELLDRITKSDSYLPDSILHDDLDAGMLDFCKENFVVISDGEKIPFISKIMTIQRWGEFTNNWEFSDDDGNVKLPFIALIRKPDVQPGTNPSVQRTIPDRSTFYYASVPTWNGTQMGADIYKMPQPVAIDISYEVTIVCTKFRDLNKFNKIVLQKFSSRQAYTTVKGHYIPIVLDSIDDSTPMESVDSRRFYIQNYKFTLLGILIDSEEFEVKPALSRIFLMNEFIQSSNYQKKYINKTIDITVASFIADGLQTAFSVGETIGILFNVAVNGLVQQRDIDYFHVAGTSKITFVTPPLEGSVITITYYKGRNSVIIDTYGKPIQVNTEYYTYTGGTPSFTVLNVIDSVVSLDINGLIEEEGLGFEITGQREVTIQGTPVLGSVIGVTYLY